MGKNYWGPMHIFLPGRNIVRDNIKIPSGYWGGISWLTEILFFGFRYRGEGRGLGQFFSSEI